MDIPSLSMAMHQTSVQNDVGVLMLSKQLDTVEQMGAGMIQAMEQSVTPELGANIDLRV